MEHDTERSSLESSDDMACHGYDWSFHPSTFLWKATIRGVAIACSRWVRYVSRRKWPHFHIILIKSWSLMKPLKALVSESRYRWAWSYLEIVVIIILWWYSILDRPVDASFLKSWFSDSVQPYNTSHGNRYHRGHYFIDKQAPHLLFFSHPKGSSYQ